MMSFAALTLGGAETVRLKSFAELKNALEAGKAVRLVVYYAKCRLVDEGKEVPSPDAVGGMTLDAWEYFARMSVRNEKAFVSASESVLINHPRYGFILDYVKFRIYEDESADITVQYLHPSTFEVKMEEMFHAVIDDGANGGGLFLYADR